MRSLSQVVWHQGPANPFPSGWEVQGGGKDGCPPECITRQQDSRVPSGPATLSLQISRTHTEGAREARWVVGPDLNPPLPLVSPVTLASSLTLCLSVPIRRVGITVLFASWAATGAFFPLPSPTKGTSVFVIITKMIVTENQMQGFCPEVRGGGRVDEPGQGRKRWGCRGVAGRDTECRQRSVVQPLPPPKGPWLWGSAGSQGAHPGPAQGPTPTCRPVSPQSEEKYRCVSDSQCGPQRFPGGGECSPSHPLAPPECSWDPGGQHIPHGGERVGTGAYWCSLCARPNGGCPQGSPQPGDAGDRQVPWEGASTIREETVGS